MSSSPNSYPKSTLIVQYIELGVALLSIVWSLATLGILTCPIGSNRHLCCLVPSSSSRRKLRFQQNGIDHPATSTATCDDGACCPSSGIRCCEHVGAQNDGQSIWRQTRYGKSPNAAVTTLIEIFLSSFFFLVWRLAAILRFGYLVGDDPDVNENQESSHQWTWDYYSIITVICAPLSVMFATLALLNASLMWYEISGGSNSKRGMKSKVIKNISKASRTLYFAIGYESVLLIYFLCFIIAIAVSGETLQQLQLILGSLSISFIPFIIVLFVVFIICGTSLIRTISNLMETLSKFQEGANELNLDKVSDNDSSKERVVGDAAGAGGQNNTGPSEMIATPPHDELALGDSSPDAETARKSERSNEDKINFNEQDVMQQQTSKTGEAQNLPAAGGETLPMISSPGTGNDSNNNRGSVLSTFARKLMVAFDVRNKSSDSSSYVATSNLFSGTTGQRNPAASQDRARRKAQRKLAEFAQTFKDFENRITIVQVTIVFVSIIFTVSIAFLLLFGSLMFMKTNDQEGSGGDGAIEVLVIVSFEGLCLLLILSQIVLLGYVQGYGLFAKKKTTFNVDAKAKAAKAAEQAKRSGASGTQSINRDWAIFSRFKHNVGKRSNFGANQQRGAPDNAQENENQTLEDGAQEQAQRQDDPRNILKRERMARELNTGGDIELFDQVVLSLGRSTSSLLRLTQKVSSKFSRSGGFGGGGADVGAGEDAQKFTPQHEGIGEEDEIPPSSGAHQSEKTRTEPEKDQARVSLPDDSVAISVTQPNIKEEEEGEEGEEEAKLPQ